MKESERGKCRKEREEMVAQQIASRGIKDKRVLEAMRTVPRERFIRDSDRKLAFYDGPLSIGCGQTISQPYIVAYMTDMLELSSGDRVLEIGTGSGYQTAVLAELASEVYTIEIVDQLGDRARMILEELGYGNIHYRIGDGYDGWSDEAPFDAIIVTAAPPKLPDGLVSQLANGGRMSVPVGRYEQLLIRITRREEKIEEETMLPVRFVPMTGGKERDR